jgi:hypothetical protein
MQENKITIELNAKKDGKAMLNEFDWLRAFGQNVKSILSHMFGGDTIPLQVRGTPGQVRAFAETLGREKDYMGAWRKYGLDDPRTYRSKGKLDAAIEKFERTTGLQWPFD